MTTTAAGSRAAQTLEDSLSSPARPSQSAPLSQPLVRLDTVSKLYGTFAALRKITLDIEPARCYVLLGENGAGKSTLLRVLAGLIRPSYGTVRVFEGLAPDEARGRIGYMSHAPMLYDQMTGEENLAYFAGLYRSRTCLTPAEALSAVGLDPALQRPISQYSQGMRQRASLARVLLSQPELLLLDEPFSNMDIASAHQMLDLLHTIRAAGRTIVLTTHQRELAEPLADSLIILQAGAVAQVLDGPARLSGTRPSGTGLSGSPA